MPAPAPSGQTGGRAGKNLFYSKGKSQTSMSPSAYSARKAVRGKDIGKKGKMFSKIEKMGDKKYGKGHGAKIAGAILAKLRK